MAVVGTSGDEDATTGKLQEKMEAASAGLRRSAQESRRLARFLWGKKPSRCVTLKYLLPGVNIEAYAEAHDVRGHINAFA
jgi:hypothetical protein